MTLKTTQTLEEEFLVYYKFTFYLPGIHNISFCHCRAYFIWHFFIMQTYMYYTKCIYIQFDKFIEIDRLNTVLYFFFNNYYLMNVIIQLYNNYNFALLCQLLTTYMVSPTPSTRPTTCTSWAYRRCWT